MMLSPRKHSGVSFLLIITVDNELSVQSYQPQMNNYVSEMTTFLFLYKINWRLHIITISNLHM